MMVEAAQIPRERFSPIEGIPVVQFTVLKGSNGHRLCENSIKEVLRELTNHYLPNVGHLLYI
jgi:uncharacterized alpha/beta hydrolase family protein